ncbi:MAG: hypothetical protein V3S69_02560 [Dehalococcoidales bacterium]
MSIEDIGDELCEHCPRTDFGMTKVNTSQFNLCEGSVCEEAHERYLEEREASYEYE